MFGVKLSRWTGLGVGAAVVALAGLWLAVTPPTRPGPSTGGGSQVTAGSLDDLVMELQLLPMEGQTPKPFTLEALDGRRVALADLAGRPALLYFWATW